MKRNKSNNASGGSWLVFNPSKGPSIMAVRKRRKAKRSNPGKKRGKRRSYKRAAGVTVVRVNPRRKSRRNPSRRASARRNPSRRRSYRRNPSMSVGFKQLGKAALGGVVARGVDMLVQKATLEGTKMRAARFLAGAASSFALAYAGAPNLALGAAGYVGGTAVDLGQQEWAYRKALAENKTANGGTGAGTTGLGSVRQIAQASAMRQGFGSMRQGVRAR